MKEKEVVREHIRKSYADVAAKGSQGCGCVCNCNDTSFNVEDLALNIGYKKVDLSAVPTNANLGLGCGNPLASAGLKEGEVVLDLGSGAGFDCFLARNQVKDYGYVIGVDMTPEMIKLSRENLTKSGYTNMEFRLGEIEHLPVKDQSIDVIISNCVINLSLEKQQVFNEAYRVLKPGGRLALSDVVATAKLPLDIKEDLVMIAGCIGGADYIEDLRAMLVKSGFKNIVMLPKENSREIISNWVPGRKVEEYVASYIIQAHKG